MKKILKPIIILAVILFLLIEFSLRKFMGLGKAPIYISSNQYEYISAPNQEGNRFGNHYLFNSYSHRSNELNSNKKIILGLGDSVIFGGVQSDQDSIATSIFSNISTDYQMLNISTGSWGPDNCAAYLKEKGTFDAEYMFLVVSSHDAHDNMDFQPVVGVSSSYPDKQYPLAWAELFDRYLIPRISKYFSSKENLNPDEKIAQGIQKKGIAFNPGFNQINEISINKKIPLYVYLHAEISELKEKEYNNQGKEIIAWAKKNNINLIKELDYDFTESDYRDNIHINDSGQKKLATIMLNTIPLAKTIP